MAPSQQELTREDVVQKLVDALKPLDYVHAFWEAGAAAFNRIDEWSDIDIYIVVDDDKVQETFLAVEDVLKSLSPIAQKLDIPQLPWPGVSQAFYKLQKASEYLLVDLAVFKLSSPEKLLEPEMHGNAVFHFNKSGGVKIPHLNEIDFARKLQERSVRLRKRFDMFNVFVQKEINRGNYLEAIDLYHNLTLAMLVEALRIKHNPVHYEFRMRYICYELPSELNLKLERLSFVKDKEDLQKKYLEATEWLRHTVSELDQA